MNPTVFAIVLICGLNCIEFSQSIAIPTPPPDCIRVQVGGHIQCANQPGSYPIRPVPDHRSHSSLSTTTKTSSDKPASTTVGPTQTNCVKVSVGGHLQCANQPPSFPIRPTPQQSSRSASSTTPKTRSVGPATIAPKPNPWRSHPLIPVNSTGTFRHGPIPVVVTPASTSSTTKRNCVMVRVFGALQCAGDPIVLPHGNLGTTKSPPTIDGQPLTGKGCKQINFFGKPQCIGDPIILPRRC